jgi:hypothetical protein
MTRRDILRLGLLGSAALALGSLAVPAFAAGPVSVEQALQRAHQRKLGQIISDGKITVQIVDDQIGGYGAAMNSRVSGKAGQSLLGRLGAFSKLHLAGRLLGPVGIVLTIATVGIELYNWYSESQQDAAAVRRCQWGQICRVQTSTGEEIIIQTVETSGSASNWSLNGARGGNRWAWVGNEAAGAIDGQNYWRVWWKYTAPAAQFQASHTIPIAQSPNDALAGVSRAVVEDALKALPETVEADRQRMADLMNALAQQVALNEPGNQLAQVMAQETFTASDFESVPARTLGSNMVSDLDFGTRNVPPGTGPLEPEPSPTPTPPATGGGGTTNPPAWETPPSDPAWPSITPLDWFPNPFSAPSFAPQCVNPNIPGELVAAMSSQASAAPVPIGLCEVIDQAAPFVGPVVATSGLIGAGKIILDI